MSQYIEPMWFPPCSPSPQQEVQAQTTSQQIAHLKDRPSSSTRLYDLWDRFGTYKTRGPFVKSLSGATPTFQIPHTSGYLSQEVKEDLRIDMLFQYVPKYSKKMKHTRIELSKPKLGVSKLSKLGLSQLWRPIKYCENLRLR